MKAVTLALVAALPAALAQCSSDRCSDAVNSLLSGGEALAGYASDLCSSAIATTTTISAGQSTPTSFRYGGYLDSVVRKDKRGLFDHFAPSWASGCKNRAQFASACHCASVVAGTSTVSVAYSPPVTSSALPSSTPVAPIVTGTGTAGSLPPYKSSSSVPFPNGNTSIASGALSGILSSSSISIPSGYSSGVPLSSAAAASIAFMPAAAITAGPSGPSSLASPSSSSSSISVPSGFSSGVPLSSAEAASIAFVPAASVTESPTGPTTLLTKVSSSSSISVPSGFSSGVPLSSAEAASIAFVPVESVTATPSGPTSLAPGVSPAVTTSSMLPGASATAQKAKRHSIFGKRAPGRHTPCPPRQVGIFFDLLTSFASPACGETDN